MDQGRPSPTGATSARPRTGWTSWAALMLLCAWWPESVEQARPGTGVEVEGAVGGWPVASFPSACEVVERRVCQDFFEGGEDERYQAFGESGWIDVDSVRDADLDSPSVGW